MRWQAQLPVCTRPGGQILTCMPAGDSKNEPHQGKKPSFFFQCERAITRKQDIKHQQPAAPSHNHTTGCSVGAFAAPQRKHSQGKTTKKQQSNWVFSFPPEERVPFSQPRKDHGAQCYGKGAFSAPQDACNGTTQQSKRSNRRQGKTTTKQQSKWCFLFLLRRGRPSLSQGKMMARNATARSVVQQNRTTEKGELLKLLARQV